MTDQNPLVGLLMHSIAKEFRNPDGSVNMAFDPEQLRYRLMSVHAPNFVAFVKAYKDVITLGREMVETQLPGVGEAVANRFVTRVESMMISTTAESSHDAEMMKLMLEDKREIRYMDGSPKSRGLMDRIAGGTAPQDGPPPP